MGRETRSALRFDNLLRMPDAMAGQSNQPLMAIERTEYRMRHRPVLEILRRRGDKLTDSFPARSETLQ